MGELSTRPALTAGEWVSREEYGLRASYLIGRTAAARTRVICEAVAQPGDRLARDWCTGPFEVPSYMILWRVEGTDETLEAYDEEQDLIWRQVKGETPVEPDSLEGFAISSIRMVLQANKTLQERALQERGGGVGVGGGGGG
jgi:hypothetical protein